jgi:hypothetical protein
METAGVWEQSAVLASSDHWFRGAVFLKGDEDHRVPFLLKLPYQREGAVFDPSFNTVLSQDLVLDILRGRVADARAAARWLETRRASAPRAALEIEARTPLTP